MIDHRRLQRALFRMQLDGAFARAVFEEDAEALSSLGLGLKEYALLLRADPAGIGADPGGRRRTQVLANASSEFTLSLVIAGSIEQAFLQRFASAPDLHRAIDQATPLPFAFADYAETWAKEHAHHVMSGVLQLERAMATCRRAHRSPAPQVLPEGTDLCLPPGARLVRLPLGTFTLAGDLRVTLDSGRQLPAIPKQVPPDHEVILLVPRAGASHHGLAEIHAESLAAPADELFLRLALSGQAQSPDSAQAPGSAAPFDAAARALFAEEVGATPAELEGFLEGLLADGLLARPES